MHAEKKRFSLNSEFLPKSVADAARFFGLLACLFHFANPSFAEEFCSLDPDPKKDPEYLALTELAKFRSEENGGTSRNCRRSSRARNDRGACASTWGEMDACVNAYLKKKQSACREIRKKKREANDQGQSYEVIRALNLDQVKTQKSFATLLRKCAARLQRAPERHEQYIGLFARDGNTIDLALRRQPNDQRRGHLLKLRSLPE